MQRNFRFLAAAALGLTAAACGGLKDDLGLAKKAPDEFAVVRNAPLSLPPNFNLRPPKPGEVGDGRLEQRDQARALLVGGAGARSSAAAVLATARAAPAPVRYSFVAGREDRGLGEIGEHSFSRDNAGDNAGRSAAPPVVAAPGERALLARLNAADVDPNIRRRVDEEANLLAADDRNLVERMMFWRKLNPPGVIVEPAGEARRINENSALGKPVTKGETPEIRVERLSSGFSGIKLF